MNIWNNSVITQKGLALQAKLIAGTKLAITRAVVGKDYSSSIGSMTEVNAVGSLIITAVTYPEEGKCALKCRLTNVGLTWGYTATQIGVYANDPDEGEILYFVAQAENGSGTSIPSGAESPGYIAEWNFYFQYGHADEVEVTVDPANTVAVSTYNEGMAKKADKNLSNLDDGAFFGRFMKDTVFTTAGTGADYTVKIPGVTALFPGLTFTMIPHVASTTTGPTLNVNGIGKNPLRQRLASTTGATTTGAIESWMSKGIPVTVTFNGTLWMVDQPRTSASYIYGTVGIEHGGTNAETAEKARENLGAAPAGHGLGVAADYLPDKNANNVWQCGFYRFGTDCTNVPFDWGYMIVLSPSDYNSERTQVAISQLDPNVVAMRSMVAGTWGEWEYRNPPMVTGVEYKTTERINGHPVYTKLISLGALPAVGHAKTIYTHLPGLAPRVVRFCGHIDSYGKGYGGVDVPTGGHALPYKGYSELSDGAFLSSDVEIFANHYRICLVTHAWAGEMIDDPEALSATAQVWYTKDYGDL